MLARWKDRILAFAAYGANGVPVAAAHEKTIDAHLDAIIASLLPGLLARKRSGGARGAGCG